MSSNDRSDSILDASRVQSASSKTAVTCMIVEDEAMIALALEDDLRDAGYDIVGPFATCAAALQSLKQARPGVAVLDTVLKDGSCLELARELTDLGVPFLIYSGRDGKHEDAPEFAGVPWVAKPALQQTVVNAVRKLTRR